MATYNPGSLGIKAPSGGFQQGGWYNGRQYWGGTLSEPGQIHPSSDQQGAGQDVSKEVVQQTNPANWDYIQQQKQQAQQKPVTPAYTPPPQAQPQPQPTPTGGGGGATLPPPAPAINLNDVYKNLYASSGISGVEQSIAELEKQLTAMSEGYNKATSNINDNPFLSEATRVGRNQKLNIDYQNSAKTLQDQLMAKKNDIATKKADIETQLNIKMKQFDIDSELARQAREQFNMLLSSGALDGATGEDIANITRSTGISSSMIYSAVNARKQKDLQTSTIQYDDGTNQGFAVINTQTGEIISKQVVAPSKPSAPKAVTDSEKKSYYMNALREDASKGAVLSQVFNAYSGFLEPDLIYQLYNSSSKYGADTGDYNKLVKSYGLKPLASEQPTSY